MMFGEFKVLAGDFSKGSGHQVSNRTFLMRRNDRLTRETIYPGQIRTIEVASDEAVKRLGGTLGWGLAGGMVFGPVGLLAGLIAGGRGRDITFICVLKDGRKFMATAPSKVYKDIVSFMYM